MWKLALQALIPRLQIRATSRRGIRRFVHGLLCLAVPLLFVAAARPSALPASGMAPDGPGRRPSIDDPVYDHFLQRFLPFRANAARRHYLTAELMSAARQNRIDPDLLFALVAVESNFNSAAVSSKGARGLGQIMFPTGRAVAPMIVRRPGDLYSVPQNLYVTARHLQELLIEWEGDLRAALTAYHAGSASAHVPGPAENRYVALICTYYATLKVRRHYEEMVAVTTGRSPTAEN